MNNADKRKSGSYYTPVEIINFMCRLLVRDNHQYHKVLEPSAGDGRMISRLCNYLHPDKITAIEKDEHKVREMKCYENRYIEIIRNDFLSYSLDQEHYHEYDLIIGNPPYINIYGADERTKQSVKMFCEKTGKSINQLRNLWAAFIYASEKCLADEGAIFFVLPDNFMQGGYAEKIRKDILTIFPTVRIITFQEKIFKDTNQEACLVYLSRRKGESAFSFECYRNADSIEMDFVSHDLEQVPEPGIGTEVKSADIACVLEMAEKYPMISKMAAIKGGIVTGSNETFLLRKSKVKEIQCERFTKPVLLRPALLNNNLILDQAAMKKIIDADEPSLLLDLNRVDKNDIPQELLRYLDGAGKNKDNNGVELKMRYKCAHRPTWYQIPIIEGGTLFFFRRYKGIPRIIMNMADACVTDNAFNITPNDACDAGSLAFCILNSLTLIWCFYHGRRYPSGLQEMMPKKFRKMPVPYKSIDKNDQQTLVQMIKDKENPKEIISFVDGKTINCTLNSNDLTLIRNITDLLGIF